MPQLSKEDLDVITGTFADKIIDSLGCGTGLSFSIDRSQGNDWYEVGKSLETIHDIVVDVPFSGSICGDFLICTREQDWKLFITELAGPDEAAQPMLLALLKESLNIAVGGAFEPLKARFPNLTFVSPRASVGVFNYPETDIVSFTIHCDAGFSLTAHVCLNAARQKIQVALKREQEAAAKAMAKTGMILRSLSEFLVIVKPDLTIDDEMSDAARRFFARDKLSGTPVLELLFPVVKGLVNEEARQRFENFMAGAFSMLVPDQFEDLARQAPRTVTYPDAARPGRQLKLSVHYSSVVESDEISRIVVSMRDVTEVEELKDSVTFAYKLMTTALERMESLKEDEMEAQAVTTFLEDMIPMADDVCEKINSLSDEDVNELFRKVHTIKGGARNFHLHHVQHFAHEAESVLAKIRSGDIRHDEIDLNMLKDRISTVRLSLKTLKALLYRDTPADRTIGWISFVANIKKSTIALGHDLDKDVTLVMDSEWALEGKDLSLVSQTLPHLIRNSIDHGIESKRERVEAGKPPSATLRISLTKSGNTLSLNFYDDGRGINRLKVKEKAVARNLIPADVCLDDNEQLLAILAHPGFSTQEKVTEISGRGVGMDAVREAFRAVGGSLKLARTDSKGTEWSMSWQAIQQEVIRVDSGDNDAVLVVDDDHHIREHLIDILRRYTSKTIHEAGNGLEALNILEQEAIGVIFTDIVMPKMSGWRFLGELLKNYPRIPVVVVSGIDDLKTRKVFSDLGVSDFVEKPFTEAAITAAFRKASEQSKLLRGYDELSAKTATYKKTG